MSRFRLPNLVYSQRQPENKVCYGAATMAYRPIPPHPPCQRTACQQAVRNADKRFRLPNICARVHALIHFQAALDIPIRRGSLKPYFPLPQATQTKPQRRTVHIPSPLCSNSFGLHCHCHCSPQFSGCLIVQTKGSLKNNPMAHGRLANILATSRCRSIFRFSGCL